MDTGEHDILIPCVELLKKRPRQGIGGIDQFIQCRDVVEVAINSAQSVFPLTRRHLLWCDVVEVTINSEQSVAPKLMSNVELDKKLGYGILAGFLPPGGSLSAETRERIGQETNY